MIRVGVIGVGHLGYHHARVYTEILGAHLVGVVDINEDRAVGTGESLRVPFYGDLDTFLDREKPDAVSVVVPTCAHYEVTRSLLLRGVHVLVEKPVTSRVDEAEDLLRLAAQKNRGLLTRDRAYGGEGVGLAGGGAFH